MWDREVGAKLVVLDCSLFWLLLDSSHLFFTLHLYFPILLSLVSRGVFSSLPFFFLEIRQALKDAQLELKKSKRVDYYKVLEVPKVGGEGEEEESKERALVFVCFFFSLFCSVALMGTPFASYFFQSLSFFPSLISLSRFPSFPSSSYSSISLTLSSLPHSLPLSSFVFISRARLGPGRWPWRNGCK